MRLSFKTYKFVCFKKTLLRTKMKQLNFKSFFLIKKNIFASEINSNVGYALNNCYNCHVKDTGKVFICTYR